MPFKMESFPSCPEFIISPTKTTTRQNNYSLLLASNFKVKKRYRRTIIEQRKCSHTHQYYSPSSLNILLFPLFLILVVIPSLPLNHHTFYLHNQNLKSSIFAQATSNSPDTRQISAPISTTSSVTSSVASSPSSSPSSSTSHQAANASLSSANNSNQTATTASSNSSPTLISTTERLLNLVKTNFANNKNQTTSGRSVPLKVRPVSSYGQQQHQQFETAYACEGNRLELSCREEGKLIHVVRANYGRFSLSICNELGHSNLSTDCASFRAFLPMQSRCNKQSNCSVNVSKELFGDPCENTPKYLEVQYYCKDVNNNNNGNNNYNQQGANSGTQTIITTAAANNGIQQNILAGKTNQPQQQPDSSAILATPVGMNGVHKSRPTTVDSIATTASNMASGVAGSSLTADGDLTSDFTGSNKQETTVIQQTNLDQYCAPQSSSRNLYWNYTRAGSVARQACPEGSSGKTSWFCDPEKLKYLPAWSPDFTQCESTWLARLANQLNHMLEMPSKQQLSTEALKQQNEQILKVVLNDLALMARTKELFSKDLKRIDIMISQIITQIRSLSAIYGSASLNNWRSSANSGSSIGLNSFNILYEDLFNKLVNIVSSLFDVSQRSAWLDIQPNESRKRLEQNFLNHLKDSGILLANSANQLNPMIEFQPIRQANVYAAVTVINNGLTAATATSSRFSPLNTNMMDLVDGNEFNQQQQQQLRSSNKFTTFEDANQHTMNNQLSEFKIHTSILRELVTNGITKFLVLDVRKPDYSLIRQQLESTYASTSSSAASSQVDGNLLDNSLIGEQQMASRVFGLFAIVGENGDVLDGQQHANLQLQNKLADLLAQWPISVDFKLSPSQNPAVIPTTTNSQQNNQALKQCNSLNSDNINQQQQNRCQTLISNVTNHICRCDQFGFVSLTTSASNQQVPTSILGDFHWPTMFGTSSSNSQQPVDSEQRTPFDLQQDSIGNGIKNGDFISSAPSYINSQGKQQASLGVWSTIFVVLGISLLVVTFVAFFINFILKSSSQTRLSKKQAGFSNSMLHSRATGGAGDLNGLSTTGPMADHSLIGNLDPIVNHSPSQVGVNSGNSTAASMMGGLSQSGYQIHKAHQQLYTSHLPPIEVCSNPVKRWTRWAARLKPSRWPLFSTVGKGVDHIIEHRVIGPSSVSYKSQYQNGYTTALHHGHQSTATSQMPLAAPSSSTSSYVSSSAYYEEIGPGNLTKINTNQLANNNRNTLTIVDPFKRQQFPVTADQQQLLTSNQQSHIHNHQPWQASGLNSTSGAAATTTTALSYSLDSQQQQSHLNYGQPLSAIFKQQQQQQLNNNDLNQAQSSSSSAASQHSASTSVTTANGSTPRHYLFASPSAVNAYKSSMSQQTLHNHHHHHLQQPLTATTTQYQHQFKQDQHQNHSHHNHNQHHHHGRQFMQN